MRSDGRSSWWFGVLALALAAVVLPACSSDDSGGGDGGGTEAAADAEDLSADQQEIVDAAQAWVDDEADLDDELKDQLQFTTLDEGPHVSNVTFTQFIDDHRVVQGELVVHVLEDGSVQGANNALVTAEPSGDDGDTIDEAEAEENASKAVDGTPEEVGPTELVWTQTGSELVLAYAVDVVTSDPDATFRVLVNATTGDVIETADAVTDRAIPAQYAPWSSRRDPLTVLPASARLQSDPDACDPGPAPSACLFLPDPIYSNGGEPPDPNEANEVLEGRELEGLDDESRLVGEYVDTEAVPTDVEPTVEEDGTWAAGRARPGFEAAMSYYWIDRAHRLMDDLGFGEVWGRPIPVEPVDTETVDNAFWDGQAIHMGVGSDGINEGEDASGIVHEYGHAVLDEQAPALFDSPEGGAYHEGFGDMLALFVSLEDRTGDAGCLFPWTESLECLRRLDTDLVYPDDLVNEVHADGMIYTGAVWDIFEGLLENEGLAIEDCLGSDECSEVRDRVLTTLLTSHGYLVSGTTLPDVAAAFVQANEAVTGGEDVELIDAAFGDHGLSGGGSSTVDPNGEIEEPEEGVPAVGFEIQHSYRGDLDVSVGVVDADGNELCEPVTIHEPDSSDGEDNLTGLVELDGTDCADLMPPSEDQQWYLTAIDALAQDTGEIVSFTVYDGTDPYDAPGLPLPIADADPEGTTVLVDGSGEGPDNEDLPDESDGEVTFDLELTHSYVGDLSIRAGTADDEGGNVECSVDVLSPDPGNAGDGGLSGSIDMSACADQYPPSDDTRWFLQVIDTAAVDEGTVDSLTLNGPDGSIEFTDLPATIPDDDEHGLVLLTDGERAEPTSSPGGGAPELQVSIEHPYSGDLSVEVGAVDENDDVLCQEQVSSPDSSNSEPNLEIDQPLADCAGAYPPEDGVRFYLFVADTLAQDEGRLVSATLTGPDGQVFETQTGDIPDADPGGVTTFFRPV